MTEATEGHIALNLVSLSHAESSVGADLAIVLDSHDCVKKTILFDQAAVDHTFVGILGRGVLKRISLLLLSNLLCFLGKLLLSLLALLLDVDVGAVADEGRKDLVVLVLVLRVHVAELAEHEVFRRGEEEALRGELVLHLVCNSHRDVVILRGAAHTAPEEQFLEFRVSGVIQELLQTHGKTKPTLQSNLVSIDQS